MVEYVDIRGELQEYADTAAVRRHARGVVSRMLVGGVGIDGVIAAEILSTSVVSGDTIPAPRAESDA